jgi:alpha-tubulin suppressor-like RCC1 family protein
MRALFGLVLIFGAASCNLIFRESPGGQNDAAVDAVDAPPATGWVSVSAGIEHTCAIDNQGGLWCWGSNRLGQLGQPLTTRNSLPTKVNNETWTMVSGRGLHTCAIRSDKTLWCWGSNSNGQLGIGTTVTDGSLNRVTDKSFTFVETSRANTCAIDDAGRLSCWGENLSKQIGDPAQNGDAKAPVTVDAQATWLTVAVGDSHACGLHADHTLWCWGSNRLGQLNGMGGVMPEAMPILAFQDNDWAAITTFAATTCGLKSNGSASCWGINDNGEFGNATVAYVAPRSVAAGSSSDWNTIVLGAEHTCGIKRDTKEWWCWGNNGYGQFGQFSASPLERSPVKMATDAERRWLTFALGSKHTCAIDESHQMYCMGGDHEGQLGLRLPVRGPQSRGGPWGAYSINASTACGNVGNDLKCWGNGRTFQIGNDMAASQQTPQKVTLPNNQQADAIAVGTRVACATSGTILNCWGTAYNGEFGNGIMGNQVNKTPTSVLTLNYTSVVATQHVCAVAGGDTYCWGENDKGQATQTPGMDRLTPLVLTGFKKVTIGATHSCGALGLVWKCWGDNTSGQLGNPSNSGTIVDVDVSNLPTNITLLELSAGTAHTCAIASNKAAYCWGRNLRGEVGDGTTSVQQKPTEVKGDLLWRQLAPGLFHTCGVTTDFKLYCWGDNSVGQIGAYGERFSRVPVQVGTDADWESIDAGDFFTCARKMDSSLWCWGYDAEGQVGGGTAWRPTMEAAPLPK